MSRAWIVALCAACGGASAPAAPLAPTPPPSSAPARSNDDAEAELEERVRQVVVATRRELRACYERGLARDATLAGRLTLMVEIDQSGRAAHVLEGRRDGGFTDDDVKCFARVLRETRFHDGAANPMRIQIPLSFSPDTGG
ncbi:MAG TPA: AgmX/PglI C-terminal domain-containing protein [Labilithrix sp.]